MDFFGRANRSELARMVVVAETSFDPYKRRSTARLTFRHKECPKHPRATITFMREPGTFYGIIVTVFCSACKGSLVFTDTAEQVKINNALNAVLSGQADHREIDRLRIERGKNFGVIGFASRQREVAEEAEPKKTARRKCSGRPIPSYLKLVYTSER